MKTNDLKILTQLRQNARIPLTKMSKEIQVPVSTIFDKIKSFEDDLIVKHTALLDFQKLGFDIRSSIFLKVAKASRNKVKSFLISNQLVNTLLKINNGYDFMVEAFFKKIQDQEKFIETLEEKYDIVEHKAFNIIQDLKRETFMSDPNLN